jgi:hypothetical protein
MRVLGKGESNPKQAKELNGYDALVFNLSMAASDMAVPGKSVCGCESPACRKFCLNVTGRGPMSRTMEARERKARRVWEDRAGLIADVIHDLHLVERQAIAKGMAAVVRLNAFSDLPWENWIDMADFPTIQFYDYTKNPRRYHRFLDGKMPANYHLTFSRSEINGGEVKQILRRGGNVAVIFDREIPDIWGGRLVIDGTTHDFRFKDSTGVVVGLLFKEAKTHKGAGAESRAACVASGFIAA